MVEVIAPACPLVWARADVAKRGMKRKEIAIRLATGTIWRRSRIMALSAKRHRYFIAAEVEKHKPSALQSGSRFKDLRSLPLPRNLGGFQNQSTSIIGPTWLRQQSILGE